MTKLLLISASLILLGAGCAGGGAPRAASPGAPVTSVGNVPNCADLAKFYTIADAKAAFGGSAAAWEISEQKSGPGCVYALTRNFIIDHIKLDASHPTGISLVLNAEEIISPNANPENAKKADVGGDLRIEDAPGLGIKAYFATSAIAGQSVMYLVKNKAAIQISCFYSCSRETFTTIAQTIISRWR